MLNFIDQRLHIPATHIHTYIDTSRGFVTTNLHRTRLVTDICHLFQWNQGAIRKIDIQILDVINTLALLLVETYHHIKTFLTFEYHAGFGTSKGCTYITVQFINIQSVASYSLTIIFHGNLWQTGSTLQRHILSSINLGNDVHHLFANHVQRIKILTIYLHGYILAYASEQLVKAQCNRL